MEVAPQVSGLPSIVIDGHSEHWWRAAARGSLLVTECPDCGILTYPPRRFCPTCWCPATAWKRCTGNGYVYSWSVVRQRDNCPAYLEVPYVVAMVDLIEGPRLATVLYDPRTEPQIGAPCQVRFVEVAEGTHLPFFEIIDVKHGGVS